MTALADSGGGAAGATGSAGAAGGGTALGGAPTSDAGGAAGAAVTPAASASGGAVATGAQTPAPATPAAPVAAKPGEAVAPPTPAELTLKLPEGFKEGPEMAKFKELAKTSGMKSEAAQSVVDLFIETQKAQQAQFVASQNKQLKDWDAELKADPDIGGDKYEQSIQDARAALFKYGGKDAEALVSFFKASPIGSYPPLVRLFATLGRASAEEKVVGTSSVGGKTAGVSADAFHRTMYPTMFGGKPT